MDQQKELSSSSCHCINLRRAANAVTDYYDRALADIGISINQFFLLSNIGKIEPCSVAELSRHVRLDRTTLVRNLKVLDKAGWVQNDAAPGNRKSKLHLTEAGRQLVKTAKPQWMQAQADVEACLGEEGLKRLIGYLLDLEQLNFHNKAEAGI